MKDIFVLLGYIYNYKNIKVVFLIKEGIFGPWKSPTSNKQYGPNVKHSIKLIHIELLMAQPFGLMLLSGILCPIRLTVEI